MYVRNNDASKTGSNKIGLENHTCESVRLFMCVCVCLSVWVYVCACVSVCVWLMYMDIMLSSSIFRLTFLKP